LSLSEKVWKRWGDLKHIFKNIYVPNFISKSGENLDDALLLASKHHWASKKNKNIKVHNNKCEKDNKISEKKPLLSYHFAPDNLAQSTELFPEAVVFMMVNDHPMFQSRKKKAICQQPMVAAGDKDTAFGTDVDEEDGQNKDEEDTTIRTRLTRCGVFKSRNTQRAEEQSRKKKQKRAIEVITIDDTDLQIRQQKASAVSKRADAEVKRMQLAAQEIGIENRRTSLAERQAQMNALKDARDMGVSMDILKPLVTETLLSFFHSTRAKNMSSAAANEPYSSIKSATHAKDKDDEKIVIADDNSGSDFLMMDEKEDGIEEIVSQDDEYSSSSSGFGNGAVEATGEVCTYPLTDGNDGED
jgi:hypothetical protein